jgi:hypothetical protein
MIKMILSQLEPLHTIAERTLVLEFGYFLHAGGVEEISRW